MPFVHIEQLILYSLLLLVVAILVGMIIAWAWAFHRIGRGLPLAPEAPIRPPPAAHWGAGTVLMVATLFFGSSFAVGQGYLALRPPGVVGGAKGRAGAGAGAKAAPAAPRGGEAGHAAPRLSPLETILLTCAANLAFCALAIPLLRGALNIGSADLGLFRDQWPLQVWLGLVAALLATPATYAIQLIATSIWRVSEHPVQKMMMDQFTPTAAALALVATVIFAPVVEETMFRGVLQRWLTRLLDPGPQTAAAPPDRRDEGSGPAAAPAGDEPGAQLAIVVTSVIFAAMHGAQWPDPIALFVFSLVLGGLYQRTGSLLAAMVAHGVFNGFSTLLLIAQLSAHHLKG